MAGTIEGEMDLLNKERAMSRKAVEGYRNQMASQLRSEMGEDIRAAIGRKERKEPKGRIMRIIDKILSRI